MTPPLDSSSHPPAEIIQSFLEDDPLVESYDFESDLAEGRYPGVSDWELRNSLGSLLSSFLARGLKQADVIEGGMISKKKLAELLARMEGKKSL